MTEKMTVSVFALLHGEDEMLCEAETWEAETRGELAAKYSAFLRKVADDVDGVLNEAHS